VLGAITIGSITLSSLGWVINLVMGLLFIFIGWFLYFRANNFHLFYSANIAETQNNQQLERFLRIDLILVLGTCLAGGLLLAVSIGRVFGEGYALFG
jgi:hypothetical protein